METKSNDTAFPGAGSQNHEESNIVGRLTKREYFAAMALQGILSTESLTAEFSGDLGVFAEQAVISADALIAELNKKKIRGE